MAGMDVRHFSFDMMPILNRVRLLSMALKSIISSFRAVQVYIRLTVAISFFTKC